eukprot:TRINITY_DN18111_c0_g1_i1.p2 TRINITY_DN18111_c0_g1~~TRINITY_DN18111_c0_g1_i1.p2  ORF type:complete len:325 (+),score=91.50 TRINITY_DN18111_c0_g1_i1:100-1074(+)
MRTRPRRGLGPWRSLVADVLICVTLLCGSFKAHLYEHSQAFAVGKRVLVTGAGGRTGSLVVEKLVNSGRYDTRALVRSENSKEALLKKIPMLNPKNVFVGDIQDPTTLKDAFKGVVAVIVVTSAVPKLKLWSLVPFLLSKLFGRKGKLRFGWKGDAKPEQVDWLGQKHQFDLAKEAKAKQVILVGTMTGTQKDSFLNSVGDGDGDQIVMWKRKAEVYLIDACKLDSEMKYTIMHAGGLSDAEGGMEPVAVGVDDRLRDVKPMRRIPRADVAEACVQAITCEDAYDRSFDITSVDGAPPLKPEGLPELLKTLQGANCDYTINPPP